MNSTQNILQQALSLHQSGQFQAAEQHYLQVLQATPQQPDALHYLGVLYLQCGHGEEGARLIQQSIDIAPHQPGAHSNLGNALLALGRAEEAVASYDRALQMSPDNMDTLSNRAQALAQLERWKEAQDSAERVLQTNPGIAEAHYIKAHCLRMQGQHAAAITAYEHLHFQAPGHAPGWLGQGLAHAALHQPAQASACFRQVLALDPGNLDALNNLGVMLQEAGAHRESITVFQQLLDVDPKLVSAHLNQGVAHQALGQLSEAKAAFERGLMLDPTCLAAQSHKLYLMCFDANTLPEQYLQEARKFGQMLSSLAGTPQQEWPEAMARGNLGQLRIGLVSADLRNHSVGHFVEGLLRDLDRSAVSLVAYHNSALEDDLSERLRTRVDEWCAVHSLNDEALAQQIRQDGIQILIDLSGHTAGHRLSVFAHRPAPIQVSWLGYLASTGVPGMQYLLADPVSAQPQHAAHFTEEIRHLPHTINCMAAPATTNPIEVSPLPALTNGHITFGSFQSRAKLTPQVLDAWAQVLKAVPDSRLIIQSKTLAEPQEQQALRDALVNAGISAERLTIEGGVASREDVLRNYHRIDISLDTFPYPGVTTTCESLWMGVPVVSLCGNTMLSRQGASLLTAVGLQDWAVQSTHDYVKCAAEKALQISALSELRMSLRQWAMESPLFDTRQFAQDWLGVMQQLWLRHATTHSSH